ncbi:Surface presentation of antigens protein SpaK [Pseudomonas fluorescens]|uniref:InvB/SpaK family type III secretion system chaperone n=1 Tax=Pseudomonas fluorescens TaxID=294 RepID=UPI0012420D3F|nr:Invasion protein B family [Pseudomonas fluorescens]VVP32322.1 Surface presentation of antigens protein SpaK [Pseudomonas fluorescens]
MPYIDIALLLREALELSGCSSEQIGEFDSHSTIELELVGLPSLNIAVIGEDLWFWSSLVDASPMLYNHRSEEMLRYLMSGFSSARTDQMQLVESDGQLEVRVMLAPHCIESAEALAEAIDAYLTRLAQLRDIVHQ